jgi:hypothetical protein
MPNIDRVGLEHIVRPAAKYGVEIVTRPVQRARERAVRFIQEAATVSELLAGSIPLPVQHLHQSLNQIETAA